MTLTSTQMRWLEAQSKDFGEAHKASLAEAITAVRTTRSPHAASRLLGLLSRTARPEPRKALMDMRTWLDQRLHGEPGISAERVLLELGWMRRMCIGRKRVD